MVAVESFPPDHEMMCEKIFLSHMSEIYSGKGLSVTFKLIETLSVSQKA